MYGMLGRYVTAFQTACLPLTTEPFSDIEPRRDIIGHTSGSSIIAPVGSS